MVLAAPGIAKDERSLSLSSIKRNKLFINIVVAIEPSITRVGLGKSRSGGPDSF